MPASNVNVNNPDVVVVVAVAVGIAGAGVGVVVPDDEDDGAAGELLELPQLATSRETPRANSRPGVRMRRSAYLKLLHAAIGARTTAA